MLCQDCRKRVDEGKYCPICLKLYDDNQYTDEFIECESCLFWVHMRCDKKLEGKRALDLGSLEYKCPNCTDEKTKKTKENHAKKDQIGAGIAKEQSKETGLSELGKGNESDKNGLQGNVQQAPFYLFGGFFPENNGLFVTKRRGEDYIQGIYPENYRTIHKILEEGFHST